MLVRRKLFKDTIPALTTLFVALVSTVDAQTSPASATLSLGAPTEHRMKGGETHFFQFFVKAGHYARVEVEQKNVDVIVSLSTPDNKLLAEMDGKDGRLWREAVSCIAETDGGYRLVMKAYGTADQSGSYTLRLTDNRQSQPNDRKQLEAEARLSAGKKFQGQGMTKLSEAVKEYEAAARLWRDIKEHTWEAISLVHLSSVLVDLSQNEEAITSYAKALEGFQTTKDRVGESKTLLGLGKAYVKSRQLDKGGDYYDKALTMFREVKDRRGEGDALNNLGALYANLGENEKAIDCWEQALAVRRELKDKHSESLVIHNLGMFYEILGKYDKAEDYFKKALVISRELKNRNTEGRILISLGNVSDSLNQYEKSRDYYEQALAIFREIENRNNEAVVLNNLGNVYDSLGRYEKARDYYEKALAIAREVKNADGEASILNNLGNISDNLKQYEKARSYYEQALAIYRQLQNRDVEAPILSNLGTVHENLGQYEKAQNYYEQALAIAREVKDVRIEGLGLKNLGSLYLKLSQYEKARNYSERALVIIREFKNRIWEGETFGTLMQLWQRQNNPRLAVIYGKQSVDAFQEIRGNIKDLDKESQQSFLSNHIEVYRRLSDILIAEGRLLEARAILDLLKEEEYKDLARSDKKGETVPYSKTELDVLAKIEKLAVLAREQDELQKLKKQLGDAFPSDKQQRLDQISADIKLANIEFEIALTALSKANASVEARSLEIQSEKNLQSALQALGKELNTDTVALYTVIGTEDESGPDGKPVKNRARSKFGWVILVTPKDRKAYPIDVTNLERSVFQLREALSSDKYDPRPLAEKLYTAIFRQTSAKQKVTLEQDLRDIPGKYKDKTLMWSLDGVLRYVPMAALHDGKQYLVERYRNVVFTKESLLWLMNPPTKEPQTLGVGVSTGNRDLNMSALPGVEKELTDVVRQQNEETGILEGTRRLNNQFKKQEILNLKDEDNRFRLVHIASHYSFNPVDQNNSYLLVGDGNGKLTFGDMKNENNLFGTVDLLTLSACDTGISGNGKEAEGFAYLAQSLGAKSVIASLWKVSDMGTPELMIRFYRLRAANPQMSKGEAFRKAQLEMMGIADVPNRSRADAPMRAKAFHHGNALELTPYKAEGKPKYAHPHYWAPFVLIGNWR